MKYVFAGIIIITVASFGGYISYKFVTNDDVIRCKRDRGYILQSLTRDTLCVTTSGVWKINL